MFLLFKSRNVDALKNEDSLNVVKISEEPDKIKSKKLLHLKLLKNDHSFIPHGRNEARLRGIKKATANVDKYADGVASIHLSSVVNILKLEVYMIGSSSSASNVSVTGPIEKSFSTNLG